MPKVTYGVLLGIASFCALVELWEGCAEQLDKEKRGHWFVGVVKSLEEVPQGDRNVVVHIIGSASLVAETETSR